MGQRRRPKSRNQRCRRGEILGKIQDSGEKKYKFSNQNAMEQVVGLALITSDGQRPEIRNNFLHGKVTTCPYKLKTH